MMIMVLLLLLLFVGTIIGRGEAPHEMVNRVHWSVVLFGVLLAYAMPNPFLGILTILVSLSAVAGGPKPQQIMQYVYPALTVAAIYTAVAPFMDVWMIEPILWGIGVVGCYLGIWCLYTTYFWVVQPWPPLLDPSPLAGGYEKVWRLGPFSWSFYDRQGAVAAGQGNPNHLEPLCVVSVAAWTGLFYLGSIGWGLYVPVVLLAVYPVALTMWGQQHITQGLVHLGTLAMAVLIVTYGWIGIAASVGYGIIGFLLLKPWAPSKEGHDSGRLRTWIGMLNEFWWKQPFPVKLFGTGTGTWVTLHIALSSHRHQQSGEKELLMTCAHNEFVQCWVEQGMLGGLALLSYCGASLWYASHAGPAGVAVALVAATLCSVAMLSFPWTLYHEVQWQELDGRWLAKSFGNQGLVVMSLLTALLIEAVL